MAKQCVLYSLVCLGYQWASVCSVVVDVERMTKHFVLSPPPKAVGSFVIPFPPPSTLQPTMYY